MRKQCEHQAQYYGNVEQYRSVASTNAGGTGSIFQQPSRHWAPPGQCCVTDEQTAPQDQPQNQTDKQSNNRNKEDQPTEPKQTPTPSVQSTPTPTPTTTIVTTTVTTTKPPEDCVSSPADAFSGPDEVANLNEVQLRNVKTIISAAQKLGATRDELRLALIMAATESKFYNFANNGTGNFSYPDLQNSELVRESLNYPYDAVGCDNASMGMFQHMTPFYGPVSDLMNPETDTGIMLQGSSAGPGNVENKIGIFCYTRNVCTNPDYPGKPTAGADEASIIQWIQQSEPNDYSKWITKTDSIMQALGI